MDRRHRRLCGEESRGRKRARGGRRIAAANRNTAVAQERAHRGHHCEDVPPRGPWDSCPLPATLRFLPPNPPKYPYPALLAGFGLPAEPEPSVLELLEDAVAGVHLTCLAADGSGKAPIEPVRKIIGVDVREPIALAPPNDFLGLCIAEGIETTLRAHQATGLGAWAAGTANRMPGLAQFVPPFIESVVICVDDDAAGRRYAQDLGDQLSARGVEVLLAEPRRGI